MKKISIIIVSYKSDEVIGDCLLSINKYVDVPSNDLEVIIVDNYINSKLETLINKIRENVNYSIKYVKNSKNGGFGQGNNLGVENSEGEVVFFLNPDTIIVESVFRDTFDAIHENKQTIVGYRLVDADLKPNNSYTLFPEYWYFLWIVFFIKKIDFLLPNRIGYLNQIVWIWGAAFALNKKIFEKAGSFDEKIFLCNEEPDLLRRIINRKIVIIDKKILHLEGHTTNSSTYRYKEYFKSTQYYFNKNNLPWGLFLFYLKLQYFKKLFLNKSDAESFKEALSFFYKNK